MPENTANDQTPDQTAAFGDGDSSADIEDFSTGDTEADSAQAGGTEMSEAVKALQERINTLPTVEEFQAMAGGTTVEDSTLNQKQTDVYNEAQTIAEALNQLSEEEQGQVDTSKLEALFDFFNNQTEVMAEYKYNPNENYAIYDQNGLTVTFTMTTGLGKLYDWYIFLFDPDEFSNVGYNYDTHKLTNSGDMSLDSSSYAFSTGMGGDAYNKTDVVLSVTAALTAKDLRNNNETLEEVWGKKDWVVVLGPKHNWQYPYKDPAYDSNNCDYYVGKRHNTHTHLWSYSASGNTVTAKCTSNSNCGYANGLTLTLDAPDMQYSGSAYDKASVTNAITSVTGASAESIKYYSGSQEISAPTNAGSYTAKVTIGGKTATADFEITKKSIEAIADGFDGFYDENALRTILVKVTDPANGYNITYSTTGEEGSYTEKKPSFKEVGDYTVYYRVEAGDNYETAEGSATVKIAGATFAEGDITATGYQGTYDGASHKISVETKGSANGAKVTYSKTGEDGTYTKEVPKFTNATNRVQTVYYKVSKKGYTDKVGTVDVSIDRKPVKAAVAVEDKEYDGTKTAVVKATVNTGITGESLTLSGITGTFANKDAAENIPVTIDSRNMIVTAGAGTLVANYTVTCEEETKGKITAKPVKFTWGDTNLTYNESEQSVTAEVSNKVGTDTFELGYKGNTATNVGKYTATVTSLGNSNYVIDAASNASTDWSIAKASSTYTTTPAVISGLTYNGADQTLITAGQTNAGTVKYKVGDGEWTTELPTGKNAGTYQVSYKVVGDDNHNDSKVGELSVTIAKAKVTVTPNNAEKHVGFDDPKLTPTETGLVNGEELNGVVLTRETGETTGTYKIIAEIKTEDGKDVNPNYDVELKIGTFTIKDHIWPDEWTVVREATAWSEGKEEKQCTYKDAENKQCGQKKYEIIPKKGEEDKNVGKLEKDAEVAPGAPIDQASLDSSKSELLAASKIFTEKERTEISEGKVNARVWIEVTPVNTETDLTKEEKAEIEKEAAKLTGKDSEIVYFNANLFKQVGSGKKEPISNPGAKIKITIRIPDELLNHQSNTIRDYKIIRMHNGKAEVLSGTFNSTTKEFTFETDKFSTYAISYKDTYYAPSYPVTDVVMSQDKATLTKEGETLQLTADVKPSYADNKNLTWKSSDEKVATVDKNGKVTAVANGTVTITATSEDGKHTATATITVKIAPEKLIVTADKKTLTKIGDSLQITAKVEPDNAYKKLIWKSSDEKVAIVDSDGKVTAVGTGTATITVTTEDGKLSETITITVKIPDESTVNETTGYGRLKARSVTQTNNSIKLEWTRVSGADGYIIYGNYCNGNGKVYKYNKITTITNGKTRTWTHTKLKKATYYKYIVKAYKLVNGKKVITDTSVSVHATTTGGKYGVAKAVSITKIGNKKNVTNVTLKRGKTAQITAKEIKKDRPIRHHRNICYESSNTKVATVTPDGMIQAKGKGTCTIWIYAQNGVYKAVTVTVK